MTVYSKREFLNSIEQKASLIIQNSPDGKIQVSTIRQHVYLYLLKDGKRKYLAKEDIGLIKCLAMKKYCGLVLNAIRECRDSDGSVYGKLGEVYSKLHNGIKQYVEPFVLPDDLYIKNWLNKKGNPNPISFGNNEYYTANNERVRSKSELIIADKLKSAGIPYKYEEELILKNGMRYYPDFTLLNIQTREEVYVEHCGMMDSEEYRKALYKKLANYAIGGITTGKNLVLFFEDSGSSLNTIVVDGIIKSIFNVSNQR